MIPTAKTCALHGVTEEIKYFVSLLGIGFHPDTDFNDYMGARGRRFSKAAAKKMNARLDDCFAMCTMYGLDLYEITLSICEPIIKEYERSA